MHPYPHLYQAAATGSATGPVRVTGDAVPAIATAPPPQFDGPGGTWTPETLLCAAVADCFILTFRGVSRAGQLPWLRLECRVEGVLERIERVTRFTGFTTHATLVVPPDTDPDRARRALEQAEHGCLVANSLLGTRTLQAQVLEAAA